MYAIKNFFERALPALPPDYIPRGSSARVVYGQSERVKASISNDLRIKAYINRKLAANYTTQFREDAAKSAMNDVTDYVAYRAAACRIDPPYSLS
ncbi:hypothetical protein LMG28614_06038 [Paraburkholderia ultramafica]|uniref:Uncharacterized protein n=1 Tax=Paraburkholderia ultramafica TaxID=1544867 RepID=A0A6S7DG04_9BURK|nr:hypothetical protein LMG28614_06038 [Paraburkholderia ultramafica]